MPEDTPDTPPAADTTHTHNPPRVRPTERLDKLEDDLAAHKQEHHVEPEPEKTIIEEREPDPTDPPAEEEAESDPAPPSAPAPAHRPGILW
jgi:hypothetical protein